MTQKYILVLLLIFFYSVGLSQKIVGTKALDIPQKFILPEGNQVVLNNDKFLAGNIWEVFSDRVYNKTTVKPGGGDVFKILQYLDRYYILEIKKKYLHLIKDPNISKDGIFSDQSEDFGWISSDNLLLWRHCLVDDNKKNKRVFVFNNPQNKNYFINNEDSPLNTAKYFQVLYVLKEEKNRSLLTKQIRLFGDQKELDYNIIGWVNNDQFTAFNSNVFVEPRSISDYPIDESYSDILHPIFTDRRSCKKFISGKVIDQSKILWKRGDNQEIKSNFFRFPSSSIKDSIIEVMVYYPESLRQQGVFNNNDEYSYKLIKGYCSLAQSPSNMSYHKVLLFSKMEIVSLLDLYESLLRVSAISNDTLAIANEIRNSFQINDNITNTMILNTPLETLLIKKFGYCSSNTNNSKTIRNLFISNKTMNSEYFQLIKDNLRSVITLLNNTSENSYFLSNGMIYYWLPCVYIR